MPPRRILTNRSDAVDIGLKKIQKKKKFENRKKIPPPKKKKKKKKRSGFVFPGQGYYSRWGLGLVVGVVFVDVISSIYPSDFHRVGNLLLMDR